MMNTPLLKKKLIEVTVSGVQMRVAAMHRSGRLAPVVFLHGFGSTKEDYADVALHPQLQDHQILAFDAPGCGETECVGLSAVSIPFQVQAAQQILQHYDIRNYHLVGHSMGGLAGLLLAHDNPAILSFADIEGNIAPEDCFLSRQILEYPASDPRAFMDHFLKRSWQARAFSHPLFAASLSHKVRAEAVAPIFRSMVELSDNRPLMDQFISLPCPKMFVYGDQNRGLSYLGKLLCQGVQLAEIAHSGHWPMYANPPALWARLGQFIKQSEMEYSHE